MYSTVAQLVDIQLKIFPRPGIHLTRYPVGFKSKITVTDNMLFHGLKEILNTDRIWDSTLEGIGLDFPFLEILTTSDGRVV